MLELCLIQMSQALQSVDILQPLRRDANLLNLWHLRKIVQILHTAPGLPSFTVPAVNCGIEPIRVCIRFIRNNIDSLHARKILRRHGSAFRKAKVLLNRFFNQRV